MRIWREYRSQRINEIVNHPSVHPWVAVDDKPLDLAGLLADLRHVLLMGEHGGVVFCFMADGIYEAHTQILPEGRGRWGLEFVQTCIAWMFLHSPCIELFTRVPDGNKGAKVLAVAAGGVKEMRRDDGWERDGSKIGCDVYTIRMNDWIKTASGLVERGEELHREFEEMGVLAEDHGQHEQHNRYAGLAALLVEGSQPLKAQWWYNAWAVKAGFAPMLIRQMLPLIFAMGAYEIEYDGARMRVVSCP